MTLALTEIQIASALSEMVYRRDSRDQALVISDIGVRNTGYLVPSGSVITVEDRGYYYDDSTGFVGLIVRTDDTIFVSYRGTDMSGGFNLPAMLGWSSDPKIDSNDFTQANFKLGGGTAGRSQLDAALALYDIAEANANGAKIVVVGQSLGGGLAGLVAAVRDVKAHIFAPAPFANQLPVEATFAALEDAGISRASAEALANSITVSGQVILKDAAFKFGGDDLALYLQQTTSLRFQDLANVLSDRADRLDILNENLSENVSINTIEGEALTGGLIGAITSLGATQFPVGKKVYDIGDISGVSASEAVSAAVAKHGPAIHNLVIATEGSGKDFSKLLKDDGALRATLLITPAASPLEHDRADPTGSSSKMAAGGPNPAILYNALWKSYVAEHSFYDYFNTVFGTLVKKGAASTGLNSSVPDELHPTLHSGVIRLALGVVRNVLTDTATLQDLEVKPGYSFAGSSSGSSPFIDRVVIDRNLARSTSTETQERVNGQGLFQDYGVRDINYVVAKEVERSASSTAQAEHILGTNTTDIALGESKLNDWGVLVSQAGGDSGLVFTPDANQIQKSHVIFGGIGNDTLNGGNSDDYIIGDRGIDIIKGEVGRDVLIGGDGDDHIFGGKGGDYIFGGADDDTAEYGDFADGIQLKISIDPLSNKKNPSVILKDLKSDDVDSLVSIEKIALTDKADILRVDRDVLKAKITIDMGGSGWRDDFILNRDVLDLSQIGEGVTYDDGLIGIGTKGKAGVAENLTVKNAEKIILTAKDDIVLDAGFATIIETGDGKDIIRMMGNDVAISDLSSTDEIKLSKNFGLYGGTRDTKSSSPYAQAWGGLFKYAVNAQGELLITSSVFGDMWVLNYGSTEPVGEKAGHIYLYQYEIAVKRLGEEWPAGLTIMGTWELYGAIVKTRFGLQVWQGMDPLVLDLDGDGMELSARSSISPQFDIDGDLYAEHSGWVKSDDGILVRDLNGNGVIDDVTEMFGNSTMGGFAALAALDRNGDGKVDAADDIEDTNGNGVIDGDEAVIAAGAHFSDLRVWRDLDQDGHTDAGELFTLAQLGIQSISVAGTASTAQVNGNQIASVGTYTRTDGSTGTAADVIFSTDNVFTKYVGPSIAITAEAEALPDLAGRGTLVSLHEALSLSASARAVVATTLPALTSLNLAELRVSATPILQAWAEASPLGDDDRNPATVPLKLKPHDDLHVLIRTAANGKQTVQDVAFQTSSVGLNEAGQTVTISHWARASGIKIYDDLGRELKYPTLQQLLAADVGYGDAWDTISGTLIGIVERMIGETLPLDRIQPTGTTEIPGFTSIANTMLSTIDIAVVRLAVQDGPLARFFDSLSYKASGDQFIALTDGELAPVYNAILTEAQLQNHGLDWLSSWRPILDIVVGDLVRHDGVTLLNTFGFIAQNVVNAFETVHPSLALADIASAFGVPSAMLRTGSGTVAGTADDDILYSLSTNGTLRGGSGSDEYIVGHAIGNTVIEDVEAPLAAAYDILRLVFLKPQDIDATRVGTDLVITVTATGETIRVPRQFEGELPGLFGGDYSEDTGINEIVFADGTVWLKSDMAKAVSRVDAASTTVIGTADNDYLEGGAGDDILRGQGDGDIYVFARGYGNDRIEDFEDFIGREMVDVLILTGLTPNDVQYLRDGESNDLIIKIKDTGETLTIKDQFVATYTGVFGTQWMSRIEVVWFPDGHSITAEDIMTTIVASKKTDGNDAIYGFSVSDRLDGGAGDDFLSGGNEDDVYMFGTGYGHDVIQDKLTNILSGDRDTVEFGEGLTVDDVIFSRDGESKDLQIHLRNSSDTLTIKEFYTVVETGVFGARAFDLIETFRWEDGTEKTWRTVQRELIASSKTVGDDFIAGSHFDDVIDGGAGNDVLKGGNGSDTYLFGYGYGSDTVNDYLTNILAGDDDRIVFGAGITASNIVMERFGPALSGLRFTLAGTSDTLSIEGQFIYTSINYRPYEIEWFEFGDGTVWSAATLRAQYLVSKSSAGNDTIDGFWSADVIVGGAGNDVLRGGDGSDTYRFDIGFGDDVIEESVQHAMYDDFDTIEFGAGLNAADARLARDGSDLLITFAGRTDQLRVKGQYDHSAYFAGWTDIEQIKFDDGTVWSGADIRERLLLQASTSGDDTVVGFYTADRLDGGAGNDTLRGLGGGDVYVFGKGSGQDVIEESIQTVWEDQPDTVEFASNVSLSEITFLRVNSDLVISIAGSPDTLTIRDHFSPLRYNAVEFFKFADGTILTAAQAAAGAVQSQASAGNDVITGTIDSDLLDGGLGNDILRGLDGSDTYAFSQGFGQDVIEEGVANVLIDDDDVIVFGPGLNSTDAILRREGNDVVIGFTGRSDEVTIKGQFTHAAYFDGWTDIELVKFADGVQWSDADIRAKLIDQSVSAGDDVVVGYWTDDRLDGGAGNDILRGMGGADTYAFGRGSGSDMIEESIGNVYEDKPDVVVFKDTINRSDIRYQKNGLDLVITIAGASDKLTIKDHFNATGFNRVENFAFSDGLVLTWSDVSQLAIDAQATGGDDVVTGTNEGDKISGGFGNDFLAGGTGNDAYIYRSGDGNDTIDESVFYAGQADELRLQGISSDRVSFERLGNDVRLIIAGTTPGANDGGAILLKNQADGVFEQGIEAVTFENGERWTARDIHLKLLSASSTENADTIFGFATDDEITGGRGNDLLVGNGGNDTYVYSRGDGNDTIDESGLYQGQFDTLILKDVRSTAVSLERTGNDLIVNINESATGVGDSSRIILRDQLDKLYERGVETVVFADGISWTADNLRERLIQAASTSGADTIVGFNANDTIRGGLGNDTLIGKEGSDTYVYTRGDGNDLVDETGLYQGTADQLLLTNVASTAVTLEQAGNDVIVVIAETSYGAGDGGRITLKDQYQALYDRGVENIAFSNGVTWTKADIATILAGQNTSSGVTHPGTPGNDVLTGTSGDDVFRGYAGDDRFNSGAGSDTFIYALGDGSDYIDEESGSTTEIDVLRLVDLNASDLTFSRAGTHLYIGVTLSGATITLDEQFYSQYSNYGIERLEFADGTSMNRAQLEAAAWYRGTDGNDNLSGTSGNDAFDAKLGDDILRGGTGSDLYQYGAGYGRDTVVEVGSGDDVDVVHLIGLNDVDAYFTRRGYDLIVSVAGTTETLTIQDQFYSSSYGIERLVFANGTVWNAAQIQSAAWYRGTSGDDTLSGSAGNDIFYGAAGNDRFNSGAGSDTYVYGSGDGNDYIDDESGSTSDIDILKFTDLNAADITLTRSGVHLLVGINATGQTITIDEQYYSPYSNYGLERFEFADGSNWNLSQINANGWYRGSAGNDSLTGSSWDDTLAGGAGDDTLTGSSGSDVFVFTAGFGKDTITDFVAGSGSPDLIQFDDAVFADLNAVLAASSQVGADTLITYDVNNMVTLKNVTMSNLYADDFRFV